ncbi:TetR family transcriptional regulator, partial [Tahibacter sp.]
MLEEQETNGLARAAHGRTKPERFVVRRTKAVAHCTRQKIIDAAREVFHRHGVGRSTLEQIAQVAGLTRGAVYWHFKGKAELFLEVRKDVFAPLIENVDLTLCSERYTDPLDAIEASLKVIYCTLENSSTVRQVYEIMLLRCEHVDE